MRGKYIKMYRRKFRQSIYFGFSRFPDFRETGLSGVCCICKTLLNEQWFEKSTAFVYKCGILLFIIDLTGATALIERTR